MRNFFLRNCNRKLIFCQNIFIFSVSNSPDGKNINNNSIIGNGMNKIDLDCGVGSVVVNFLR